jgi:signal transduction histidine kinase
MSQKSNILTNQGSPNQITDEYRVLHKVAQVLESPGSLMDILQKAMQIITEFEGLHVENKAGIFLADNEKKVLRLLTTFGAFSQEFIEKEKEVPFGDCLCGRVAVSGKLLMSESCFTDSRHERTFTDMKAHGHYIVPLNSSDNLIGVMFLYTDTNPSWYQHSQEVLLSIGGLIANTIQRKEVEEELERHKNSLEKLVESRTYDLTNINNHLKKEIEEHKSTQQILIDSKEKFRRLSNQIQSIREDEKSRIAKEVHDQLGQTLTALKIDIAQLEKNIPSELSELKARTSSITNIVDETIKNVQQISMELRPPILDAFGICEAISWQANEYNKKLGMQFDLNCLQEHIDLEKDLQTALFRIFQESMTNVIRHANATQVQVGMNYDNKNLIFEVADNGIGLNKEDVESPESLGLIGMRERVYPWGGQVEFKGLPGKGTKIIITIPLSLK